MKFVGSQMGYFFSRGETRRNFRALLKFLLLLTALIVLFTAGFHVIMERWEGRSYSWLSGFYWTMTVMSTLGFGDITFHSDVGRLFSTVVLLTGMLLMLVLLPFMFIRFFFAPWFEAQVRARAPRRLRDDVAGHVIICRLDDIVPGLLPKLHDCRIPYVIIEPDAQQAATLAADGYAVITGDIDSPHTYAAARVHRARMVIANASDPENANIALTVRELTPRTAICALAARDASVDILELSGATHVLPLRRLLGEHLVSRINAGRVEAHVIGHFHDLVIAELPVHGTPLAGRTLRESALRQTSGLSVLAVWEKGTLVPARPDTPLTDQSVPVMLGTPAQLAALEELLAIYCWSVNPVLIVGGGTVGRAAAAALKRRGVAVNIIEQDRDAAAALAGLVDRVITGDAADREVIMGAGLADAPSVVLTTHDDAVNIYLALYCRRLNPALRIVSRVNHERNIASMHRAGADFVLSYASLGATALLSYIRRRELMVLGEGLHIFELPVPAPLAGQALGESDIGSRTGLTVMAISRDGDVITRLDRDFVFRAGDALLLFGSDEQLREFTRLYAADAKPGNGRAERRRTPR